MKKILLISLLLFLPCGLRTAQAEIIWDEIGSAGTDIKSVLLDADNGHLIYIGSGSAVSRSEDGGESWRNILVLKGENPAVHLLVFDPWDRNSVYAATASGLYRSNNQGRDWSRIFRGRGYLENDCTAITVLPAAIYLGTKAGLFVSRDKGRSWQRENGRLGSVEIKAIAHTVKDGCNYLVCTEGVYRIMSEGRVWERVLVDLSQTDKGDIEEPGEGEREENGGNLNYLSVDQGRGEIYLATSRGVYKSGNQGQRWDAVSDYGLLNRNIKFIFISSDSQVYAVSPSGIFTYSNGRWQELSFALAAGEIHSVSLDKDANLYAACKKGLFRADIKGAGNNAVKNNIYARSQNEPGVNEVQQAAIKYAEVDPEKIQRWRRQAAKRALLPQLTVSMDRDNNRTTSSSIWGTYGNSTGTGRYYIGPDDETRYHNKNWGVSLTWELGDLIWNDDQTSIDVRSRLMVELRNDILDEVTKLYFERLRVKAEVGSLSLQDLKKRQEKELRIEELTASLDAMTGGYFSRTLKNNKET